MAPRSLKRRRALRARARQRPRADRHDLRSQYRESDLPATSQIGVLTIEDPYSQAGRVGPDGNLDIAARLEPMRHADGSVAEGAPGWTPPRRPLLTAFVALKDDPLGRMFARHQVDAAQFQGARLYQQLADQAMLGAVRSVDLGKTRVSGGIASDMLTPGKQRAMARLRKAEQRVADRYGAEGLGLCRAVLVERQTVEQTARLRGANLSETYGRGPGCSGNASIRWPRPSALRPPLIAGRRGLMGMLSIIRLKIRSDGQLKVSLRTRGCGGEGASGESIPHSCLSCSVVHSLTSVG